MKTNVKKLSLILVFSCFAILNSCSQKQSDSQSNSTAVPSIEKAIAVLYPTGGNVVNGTVSFTKEPGGIKVITHVTGLTPGKHGFHIHEFGDCSSGDANSAGGHFNPTQMPHGAPTDSQRHSGDFGNVTADSNGVVHMEWIDPMITFDGPNSIIGRAVIVHADEDDLTSQPTGAAGARVACGVIGVAQNM